MGESYQYHQQPQQPQQHPPQQQQQLQQQQQQQPTGSSRMGLRGAGGGGGEIVEVQGGHIVRSTGRKDRHSKVCTAKGPRDRRVRLSAHTAIQFYDVQDRLGYDRPSKAVDWLIKKAKAAIDELAELPAWKPTATPAATTTPNSTSVVNFEQNPHQEDPSHNQISHFEQHPDDNVVENQMANNQSSSFLPPSLDSDSIADTIKSFFPMGAASTPPNNNSTAMQFHQSFPPPDLLSRTSSRSQDLRLSLQSFQDPILHHHQQQHQQTEHGSNIFFDGSGWPENQPGGFQRLVAWGGGGDAVSSGFVFSSPPAQATPFLQPLFGQQTHNQLFHNNSQRGPLQSSNTPSIRAWIDPPPVSAFSVGAGAAVDQNQQTLAFHHNPSSLSGYGGFSGFRIPARIQGEEEEHDGISDKPSSASSDSRH